MDLNTFKNGSKGSKKEHSKKPNVVSMKDLLGTPGSEPDTQKKSKFFTMADLLSSQSRKDDDQEGYDIEEQGFEYDIEEEGFEIGPTISIEKTETPGRDDDDDVWAPILADADESEDELAQDVVSESEMSVVFDKDAEEEEQALGDPDMGERAESLASGLGEDEDGNIFEGAPTLEKVELELRSSDRLRRMHAHQKARDSATLLRLEYDAQKYANVAEKDLPDVLADDDPGANFALVADPNGEFEIDENTGEVRDRQGRVQLKIIKAKNKEGKRVPVHSRPIPGKPGGVRVKYTKQPPKPKQTRRTQKLRTRRKRAAEEEM